MNIVLHENICHACVLKNILLIIKSNILSVIRRKSNLIEFVENVEIAGF